MSNNNQEYGSPDAMLKDLHRYGLNTPDYNLAKGALHDYVCDHESGGQMTATQVSRALHRGDLSIAANLVDEILEGETE